MTEKIFEIKGVIVTPEWVEHEMNVLETFTEWLEGLGWEFCGTLGERDEDGNRIEREEGDTV